MCSLLSSWGWWWLLWPLARLILSVFSGQLIAAHGALVVLLEPLRDASLVEKMTTGHFGGLFCQVFAADWAAGVFFVGWVRSPFALFVGDFNLRQVFYWGLRGRWGTGSSHLLLWQAHYVLKNVFIRGERAEIQVQVTEHRRREQRVIKDKNISRRWCLLLLLLRLRRRWSSHSPLY